MVVSLKRGLGEAVGSGTDGGFDPGKEVGGAPAGIRRGSVGRVAIPLLPHLVEAMDWAVVVSIVRDASAEVIWNGPERKRGCVRDTGVNFTMVESSAAGGEVNVIARLADRSHTSWRLATSGNGGVV